MEEEQKRTLCEPKLGGVMDMILEYKLQLDETAVGERTGCVDAWLTKTGVGRMERDEGTKKAGIWDQRTAFVGG